MSYVLELRDVEKVFNLNTPNEKVALKEVSFSLQPGDFVTIIGSNGAGKSTLLNAIAGVFPVEKGSIVIEGQDFTGTPEHLRARLLGRVFQDPLMGTAASMTVEENLAIALKRGEKRSLRLGIKKSDREMFRERLAVLGLGLEGRLTERVGRLSGGQRQALTLLMATLRHPRVLLLDEHTAALDPKTAEKVLELTESLIAEQGLTALMVTHNMAQALQVGNRTFMMDDSRIVLDLYGTRRKNTSVDDLLAYFEQFRGQKMVNDRVLLA